MNPETKSRLTELFIRLIIVVVMFGLYITIQHTETQQHEDVHQAIYTKYGIKSNVTVRWFPDKDGIVGRTTALNVTEALEKCDSNCKLAHIMNEEITYNLDGIITSMWLLVTILLIYDRFRVTPLSENLPPIKQKVVLG